MSAKAGLLGLTRALAREYSPQGITVNEQGSPVRVRLRGSERSASPDVIRDIDEVERLVALMMAANPAVSRFIGVPREGDGRPNREKLELVVRGSFAVVRLRLDSEPRL